MRRTVAEVRSVLVAYQRIVSLEIVGERVKGHTRREFCYEKMGIGSRAKGQECANSIW